MTRPVESVATRVIARTTAVDPIRRADASSGVGERAQTVSRTVAGDGPRTANLVTASRHAESSSRTPAGTKRS